MNLGSEDRTVDTRRRSIGRPCTLSISGDVVPASVLVTTTNDQTHRKRDWSAASHRWILMRDDECNDRRVTRPTARVADQWPPVSQDALIQPIFRLPLIFHLQQRRRSVHAVWFMPSCISGFSCFFRIFILFFYFLYFRLLHFSFCCFTVLW